EQPRLGDTRDSRLERLFKTRGKMFRYEAIDGFALGSHRAALGGRNQCRDFFEPRFLLVGDAVRAETMRADQRSMDDEVGVAADRRGEVRVAAQVEAKMPEILRRIDRLALGAQHHLVDQRLMLAAGNLRKDPVEGGWPQL